MGEDYSIVRPINRIGSQVGEGSDVDDLVVYAPHDQRELGRLPIDTERTINEKARRARGAMSAWAQLGPMGRAERLLAIEADTRSCLGELAEALSLEQGKTVKEARLELERYLGPFQQYAGLATSVGGDHFDLGDGHRGIVDRQPIGVVGAIVPWNFPTSLFGTKLAPALAAGCGFLIKPAETTPLITRRLVELATPHLPDGLLDLLIGGAEVAVALIDHPEVARIAFTGSTAVGREVGARAGRSLTQVSLELGGSDPFVLLEDADLRQAVRSLMGTRFFNAGQVCVAPKRLIVHTEIADEVIDALRVRLGRIAPGPGNDPTSTMGPLHTAATRARLEEQLEDAEARGATIIGGGRPNTEPTQHGWFSSPALVIDPPRDARVRAEETFGPALTIVRVSGDDEAIQVANETDYGLGASVWSANQSRAMNVADQIPAGYVWINSLGRVYDELPFGGTKSSGFGREHGLDAFRSFTTARSYVISR